MGNIQKKFLDSKTFYNLSLLAAPKARCKQCKQWCRRTQMFKYNGKNYCAGCTPADAFNNVLSASYQSLPQHMKDDTPLL